MIRKPAGRTATILPFPADRRRETSLPPLERTPPTPVVIVEDGACWYHEAAIREAQKPVRPN